VKREDASNVFLALSGFLGVEEQGPW
jgi:hypothetical protein